MSLTRRAAARLPSGWLRWTLGVFRAGSSVSVIVRVTDHNAVLLADLVDQLGRQHRKADEIVLVVTGSTAQTRRLVARQVAKSWRVRSLELPGAGPVTARRHGAERAWGAYLWFLEAGDRVVPEAIEGLAGALDRSGLPLAIGGRPVAGRANLASHPEVLAGVPLALMMFGASSYPTLDDTAESGPLDSWLPGFRALLAAGAFAACVGAVVAGPRRGTGDAFGTMPVLAPWADRWVAEVQSALGALEEREPAAYDAFLAWLLADEAPRWLEDAERCSREQWEVLAGEAHYLWDVATDAQRAAVPVERRTRLWLGAQRRRDDLVAYNTARWREEGQFPTRVAAGRVHALLPVEDVPEEVLELHPDETRLHTRLVAVERSDSGDLLVEVVAWISGVGAQHGHTRAELVAVGVDGTRIPLETTLDTDPDLDRLAGERFQDHREGVLRGRLPAAAVSRSGEQHLEVLLERATIRRTAAVVGLLSEGTAPEAAGADQVTTDVQITEVTLEGTALLLRGRADPIPDLLVLHGPHATVELHPERTEGVGFEAATELEHEPWGTRRPLPAGAYRVECRSRRVLTTGAASPVVGGRALRRGENHRLRIDRAPDGTPLLMLGPPLADDEVGPAAQERLRRRYAEAEPVVDPGLVYLQSYTGQVATDSPAALYAELRRTRPDLRLVWGVADRSSVVPHDAETVLIRSAEWYDVLATAGAVVTNVDLEEWFRKRPGQRVLQTFHGYPSKTMGIAAWEGKNYPPTRVERLLARTSATWDLLLTPAPEMDRHYREQYRYDGPIHSFGYPRDDALVGDGARRRREEVRDLLGLGDRVAVLYAPTWRDDLATNFRSAPLSDSFDVERAAESLGGGHVLLLRGHRFHPRSRRSGSRLLDVSAYPEINDLILAADVAVLDYSSLRFDFALTERPMVFLVPDLERYEGKVRGFLYDFSSSAPGPLVHHTEAVVEAVRDPAALATEFAADLARFNAQFNAHQDGGAAARVVAAFFPLEPRSQGAGPRADTLTPPFQGQ